MANLTINDNQTVVSNSNELIKLLGSLDSREAFEVWIEQENKNSLCILANPSRLFCMYLENHEDGRSLVSFDKHSSKGLYENFKLSNGQLDEYPKNKTVDRKLLSDIFLTFYDKGALTDKVTWSEG